MSQRLPELVSERDTGALLTTDPYGSLNSTMKETIKKRKSETKKVAEAIMIKKQHVGIALAYFIGSVELFIRAGFEQLIIKRDALVPQKIWTAMSTLHLKMFQPMVYGDKVGVWNGNVLSMTKELWGQTMILGNEVGTLWSFHGHPYQIFYSWPMFNEQFQFTGTPPIVVSNTPPAKKDVLVYNPITDNVMEYIKQGITAFIKEVSTDGKYFINYPSTNINQILNVGIPLNPIEQSYLKDLDREQVEVIGIADQPTLTRAVKLFVRRNPKSPSQREKQLISNAFKILNETGTLPVNTEITGSLIKEAFDPTMLEADGLLHYEHLCNYSRTFSINIKTPHVATRLIHHLSRIAMSVVQPDEYMKIKGSLLDRQRAQMYAMFSDGMRPVEEGIITDWRLDPIDIELVRKAFNVAWALKGVLIVCGIKGTGKTALARILRNSFGDNNVIDSDDYLKCQEVKEILDGLDVYEHLRKIYFQPTNSAQYTVAKTFMQNLLRSQDYRDAMVAYSKRVFGGVSEYWTGKAVLVHSYDEAIYLATKLSQYVEGFDLKKRRNLAIFQLPGYIHSRNRNNHIDLVMNDVFTKSLGAQIYSLRDLYAGSIFFGEMQTSSRVTMLNEAIGDLSSISPP